nr:hypothetical protein [Pseudophaeobacter leonis]
MTSPGASEDLASQLQAASSVLAARAETDVQELLAAALSDYRTLVQVLYNAGHFSPQVTIQLDGVEAAHIQPLNQPRRIDKIQIIVTPGPSFRFSRAEITPWPAASAVEIPTGFSAGKPANTAVLSAAGAAGLQAWQNAGHPKVRMAQQDISANHRANTLDARLRLAPGPRLKFGTLRPANSSTVRPEALQRIAGFPTDEIYHPNLLAKSAARLRRTGAFSSVTLRVDDQATFDDRLDFAFEVEDLPPRRLTFGAELSSTDGL